MRDDATTYPFWIEESAEGRARLGLSETFLETILEPAVGLDLAPVGSRLRAGDAVGLLHVATRSLDLRAPFALQIAAINEPARRDPRLLQQAPYGRGWLIEFRRI